jgi:hypothetical protein
MSLLGKVRILIGALVRGPAVPAPKKAAPAAPPAPPAAGGPPPDRAGLQGQRQEGVDDSRVADLIARRREGGEQ